MIRWICPIFLLVLACDGGKGGVPANDTAFEIAGCDVPTAPDTHAIPDPGGLDTPADLADPGPPPSVAIVEPARGVFATGCTEPYPVKLDVASQTPLATLTLQGNALAAQTGTVPSSFQPVFGLNVIDVEAKAVNGLSATEHRALLCGEYVLPSQAVQHAADLYVGKTALGTMGKAAAKAFDDADLTAWFATMNPLYQNSLLKVETGKVEHSPGTVVSLAPAWNEVEAAFVVLDLSAAVKVVLTGSSPKTYVVVIKASKVAATGALTLALQPDGTLAADLSGLAFDFEDLALEVEGVEGDLLAAFPEYKDVLVDQIEGWLAKVVKSLVADKAASALTHVSDPIPLDVLDHAFTIRLMPSLVQVNPAGIHLGLDIAVQGLTPDPSYASPGVLNTPGQEAWPNVDGIRISIKDDMLNAVFHEAWRSGLLEFTVDQAFLDKRKLEVSLVAGFLGGVIDRLPSRPDPETPIVVAIRATYPPVLDMDLPYAGGVRLGIGDLLLKVSARPEGKDVPLMDLALTVRMDGEVTQAPGNKAEIALHAFKIEMDVVNDDGTLGSAETYLEATTAGLLDQVGPTVAGMLGTIPIPSFGGFQLTNIHAGTEKADGGVIVVSADLAGVGQ